jgi:chemotaxis protein histidine kinase CheA
MPLDPSLPSSAQQKLQQLREQIEDALQSLASDMLALSAAERETAVSEARTAAQQEKDAALESVRRECEAAVAERIAEATAGRSTESELADRLAAAISEGDAARTAAATAAAERDQAVQALAESKAARDQAEQALAALTAERDQALQSLADAKKEAAEAAPRLAEAQAAADTTKKDAAERLAEAQAAAERQIADVRAAADAAAASERTRTDQALADAKTAAEARLAESRAEAADTIALARAEADRQVAEVRARAESEARAAVAAELQQAHVGERECDLACIERVIDAMRALGEASSLSATLDTLADHLAAHVARVAILVVRNGELRIWTTAGFGDEILRADSISVPLEGHTVVARAAHSGQRTTTGNGSSETPLEPLAFAPLPADRVGLAVPLLVGGRTVAVVYADEGPSGERTVPSAWPEIVEILGRHAGACLELLTLTAAYALHAHRPGRAQSGVSASSPTKRATSPEGAPVDTSARPTVESAVDAAAGGDERSRAAEEDASAIRYARLLISEIKLYHEDAVTEGREGANLLTRLGPEISRARRLYEERVPSEVRHRADHFGQELIRTLANGDPRLLGQNT